MSFCPPISFVLIVSLAVQGTTIRAQSARNEQPLAEASRSIESISITAEEEVAYGKQLLEKFLEQLREDGAYIVDKGLHADYLGMQIEAAKEKMKHSERYPKISLHIIVRDTFDIYMLPGGHMICGQGLIPWTREDPVLLGVLYHELSHLDRGHLLLPLKEAKSRNQPIDFQDKKLVRSLVKVEFTAEQEKLADQDAIKWLMADRQPASQYVRFLAELQTADQGLSRLADASPSFWPSHPINQERIEALEAFAKQQQSK
jgi:predicted Zn-dependent protease